MDDLAAPAAEADEDALRIDFAELDEEAIKLRAADGERLKLVVRLHGDENVREAEAREAVRRFSEAGFVVLKEGATESGRVFTLKRDSHVILPYREGDEKPILELFPRSFYVPRSLEHWRWKYVDNPWGDRYLSMAWTPEGKLAAHYGGYPVPFWIEDGDAGREILAFQVGDTMTDPDLRAVGRGKNSLLGRTVRHFFAAHLRRRFGFYYGFNTGPIQRFCSWFIGGSKVSEVTFRVCESSSSWGLRGYRVERVVEPDDWFNRLFRRVAPEYGFLVRRDARWLRWRYLDCPDVNPYILLAVRRFGRLVGWGVFRRREERLVWGDALFRPQHARAAEALLATAVALPEFTATTRVEGWFGERPEWFSETLDDLGFRREPEPDGLGCMMLPDTQPAAAGRLPEMYVTMGDGDLF